MSIYPPIPVIKSKMYYMLKSKLDPEQFDQVVEKTKPYYLFNFRAEVKENGIWLEYKHPEAELEPSIDVDVVLNRLVRARQDILEDRKFIGKYFNLICYCYVDDPTNRSDCFQQMILVKEP